MMRGGSDALQAAQLLLLYYRGHEPFSGRYGIFAVIAKCRFLWVFYTTFLDMFRKRVFRLKFNTCIKAES